MATARVRRAFRYPDGNNDEHLELDEEQQEKLIADLQQRDMKNSNIYLISFTAIPIIAAAYFIVLIFTASSSAQRLDAVLAITSLAASTYVFTNGTRDIPDKKGKRPVYLVEQEKSPMDRYLSYLNAALNLVLAVKSAVNWRKDLNDEAMREALPGVIFGLLSIVKQQLRPLEWQELQQARYELKGA